MINYIELTKNILSKFEVQLSNDAIQELNSPIETIEEASEEEKDSIGDNLSARYNAFDRRFQQVLDKHLLSLSVPQQYLAQHFISLNTLIALGSVTKHRHLQQLIALGDESNVFAEELLEDSFDQLTENRITKSRAFDVITNNAEAGDMVYNCKPKDKNISSKVTIEFTITECCLTKTIVNFIEKDTSCLGNNYKQLAMDQINAMLDLQDYTHNKLSFSGEFPAEYLEYLLINCDLHGVGYEITPELSEKRIMDKSKYFDAYHEWRQAEAIPQAMQKLLFDKERDLCLELDALEKSVTTYTTEEKRIVARDSSDLNMQELGTLLHSANEVLRALQSLGQKYDDYLKILNDADISDKVTDTIKQKLCSYAQCDQKKVALSLEQLTSKIERIHLRIEEIESFKREATEKIKQYDDMINVYNESVENISAQEINKGNAVLSLEALEVTNTQLTELCLKINQDTSCLNSIPEDDNKDLLNKFNSLLDKANELRSTIIALVKDIINKIIEIIASINNPVNKGGVAKTVPNWQSYQDFWLQLKRKNKYGDVLAHVIKNDKLSWDGIQSQSVVQNSRDTTDKLLTKQLQTLQQTIEFTYQVCLNNLDKQWQNIVFLKKLMERKVALENAVADTDTDKFTHLKEEAENCYNNLARSFTDLIINDSKHPEITAMLEYVEITAEHDLYKIKQEWSDFASAHLIKKDQQCHPNLATSFELGYIEITGAESEHFSYGAQMMHQHQRSRLV